MTVGSGPKGALAQRWNGTAANCWGVGGTLNPGAPGAGARIIAHWNGAKWALVG